MRISPTLILPSGRLAVAVIGSALAVAAPAAEQPADADRWQPRDPQTHAVSRKPVTRRDYVDLVRPLARGFENGPDRGQYGPRHALPALAVYALEGDRRLGEGIKKTLRHYSQWVDKCVREQQGVFSMEGATLCAMHFRELRRRGQMTPDDEAWARRLLIALCEHHMAWRPRDGLWRGPHHRSQCQGSNCALAAAFYPDDARAARWRTYADAVWKDWWDFRDIGINDTGYFYSSLSIILRTAELLGRAEVFTDADVRRFIFDRILYEITPDGCAVPYASHGGRHGHAGAAIFALELAARYTRDGRYRWGAHRLMNFGQQHGFSNGHHHIQAISLENVALASLVCDDSVQPVEPDAASRLLLRKEVRRLTDAQAKAMFPDAGGIDCNMYMTQTVMPHKLVFRAGWNPGDMYMLVECYPRHDPLNPTAVLSLERWSAAFAEMASEKFISRENALRIEDLSGGATYMGRTGIKGEKRLPVGYEGMTSEVPVFADHALASHALVRVTNYMGYSALHQREMLFVKNGFVLVRDHTTFDDAFRARVGPIWNTQNISAVRGGNWLDTWFSAHWFQKARLYETPPWNLLIWHAPRADRRLAITDPDDKPTLAEPGGSALGMLYSTRYAWEGDITPGTTLQFIQVLLPHAPMKDASPLANNIALLADEPPLAAVAVRREGVVEVALLNPDGRMVDIAAAADRPAIRTDARAAYVATADGRATRYLARQAATLHVGDRRLLDAPARSDFERP